MNLVRQDPQVAGSAAAGWAAAAGLAVAGVIGRRLELLEGSMQARLPNKAFESVSSCRVSQSDEYRVSLKRAVDGPKKRRFSPVNTRPPRSIHFLGL